jgi:CRISPR-associated endonuclease/helicase Cas3
MTCYAHSKEGRPVEEWHRLEDHLRATAEKATQFAAPWGAGDWAWNAAWLHDLGKADSRFQPKIIGDILTTWTLEILAATNTAGVDYE